MIRPKSFATVYDIKLATLNDYHDINRIQKAAFTTPWSKDLIRSAIVNN